MATAPTDEIKMDPANLYQEQVFTDRKVGTIRMLTPVTSEGEPDDARKVIFVGQAQILTAMGAVPLNFEIDATTLADACDGFAAAEVAVEETRKELEEMRRQASSSIVVPQGPGAAGLPGDLSTGKIKIP